MWSRVSLSLVILLCLANLAFDRPVPDSTQLAPSTIAQLARTLPLPADPDVVPIDSDLLPQPARLDTPAGLDGTVLFASNRLATDYEIYAQAGDGTGSAGPRLLFPGNDVTPVWAPDGRRFLFASDRDGDYEIYLHALDGQDIQLTHNTADDIHPSWSADGDEIYFSSDRDGGYFQIYRLAASGGVATPVTIIPNNHAMHPRLSPDGSQIAFMRASTSLAICTWNWDVWVMNADGSNQQRVTTQIGADIYPSWTPDGQGLVYASCRNGLDFDLYETQLGGGEARLTNWFLSNEWNGAYAPGGGFLAFNSNIDGNDEIYTMPAGGGLANNLTQNEASDLAPSWATESSGSQFAASVSQFVWGSQDYLLQAGAYALGVAEAGDFFIEEIGEDKVEAVINLLGNSLTIASGPWDLVGEGLARTAVPGHLYLFQRGHLLTQSGLVAHWSYRIVPIQVVNGQALFKEMIWAGLRHSAREVGGDLRDEAILGWLIEQLPTGVGQPMYTYVGLPTSELGMMYQAELDTQLADFLIALPDLGLTAAQEAAYQQDMAARQSAHALILSQLAGQHDLLYESYLEALANEGRWWAGWGQILLKWSVIGGATL
ncbi:MAG: PD40 domain-containing protein, partial [Anaerolineales bacterium]|nr:PD40 domain-containing protein [Anaerolineales bacterium]